MYGPSPVDTVSTGGFLMAVHYIETSLNVQDFTAEDESSALPASHPGAGEINLGAFRGLAFALIFQTVLIALGAVVWAVVRLLR
jgi:hypothetical protein